MTYFAGSSVASPGSFVIARYDAQSGAARGTFALGAFQYPVGLVSVVAPEPAAFIGLAIGLAFIARRRR